MRQVGAGGRAAAAGGLLPGPGDAGGLRTALVRSAVHMPHLGFALPHPPLINNRPMFVCLQASCWAWSSVAWRCQPPRCALPTPTAATERCAL